MNQEGIAVLQSPIVIYPVIACAVAVTCWLLYVVIQDISQKAGYGDEPFLVNAFWFLVTGATALLRVTNTILLYVLGVAYLLALGIRYAVVFLFRGVRYAGMAVWWLVWQAGSLCVSVYRLIEACCNYFVDKRRQRIAAEARAEAARHEAYRRELENQRIAAVLSLTRQHQNTAQTMHQTYVRTVLSRRKE